MSLEMAHRIKYLRTDILKLSQEEFCDRIGKSTNYFGYLSRFENRRRRPSLSLLLGMIKNLKVQPNWLFFGTGNIFFSSKEVDLNELKNIDYRIEMIRSNIGRSDKDFAEILGLSTGLYNYVKIHGFLSDKSKQFYYLFNIIELLGVSPNWLILGVGEMFYKATEYQSS